MDKVKGIAKKIIPISRAKYNDVCKIVEKNQKEIEMIKFQNNILQQKIQTVEYITEASCADNSREIILSKWYFNITGKILDLKNPKTFNEKIQWLKINDSTKNKTILADKYEVRKFIKNRIGEKYLIKLLGVFNNADEIDFKKLPSKFALKATHSSGYNKIISNKKEITSEQDLRREANGWLSENFAYKNGLELHYADIKPKLIIEDFFNCKYEYQFWCFNGDPKFVSVIHNPHGENKKLTYDMNWQQLDFVTSLPKFDSPIKKPDYFDEMKKLSRKLCKDFIFVRVDFMHDGKKLLFSEMTFTPASGICQWYPEEQDIACGKMLKLSSKENK